MNVRWLLRILVENIVGYFFHEPVEALAIQLFLQFKLLKDVTHI